MDPVFDIFEDENGDQTSHFALFSKRLCDSIFNIPNSIVYRVEISEKQDIANGNKLFIGIRDIHNIALRRNIELTNVEHSCFINNKMNSNILLLKIHKCVYTSLNKYKLNNLPPNLKILIICNVDEPLNNLPMGLKILDIGGAYSHDLDNLPSSLKILKINDSYYGNLHNLPSSLEKLIILDYYSLEINNLPQNLSSFVFAGDYNTKINLSSCPNIKSVYIESKSLYQNTLKKKLESSYPKIKFADMNYDSYTITDDISQILGYDY